MTIAIDEFEGVLIVPRARAEIFLGRAEGIVTAERKVREGIREGAAPSDSFYHHGHI